MGAIGIFKKSDGGYLGEIVTLSMQARGIRIVETGDLSTTDAPSHRVYFGEAEIGAAWAKRSKSGSNYLSLKLDDPSFDAPVYANLIPEKDGVTAKLMWSRRT